MLGSAWPFDIYEQILAHRLIHGLYAANLENGTNFLKKLEQQGLYDVVTK